MGTIYYPTHPQMLVLAGIVIIALLALGAWLYYRRQSQTRHLHLRFGPEYARTMEVMGGRSKAEAELKAREERVGRLHIVALSPPEAARFSKAWAELQARFIDNPKGVVLQADQLVRELMQTRGYPMVDFERRSADISVDHPTLVETYRAAQDIVVRDERGAADTEALRKAVVYFRALFDELLEVTTTAPAVMSAPSAAA
jgi:hypothetical protein